MEEDERVIRLFELLFLKFDSVYLILIILYTWKSYVSMVLKQNTN